MIGLCLIIIVFVIAGKCSIFIQKGIEERKKTRQTLQSGLAGNKHLSNYFD